MANLQVIENEGEDGSQRHTEVYLPSFEVQIQQEVADMKGVKVSDETQITAAQMSLHLEIASGQY